jgi:ankyrin repeat protein
MRSGRSGFRTSGDSHSLNRNSTPEGSTDATNLAIHPADQLDGGALVNARDADGNTPLVLAAVYAGPESVELLLKKGADGNAANKAGATHSCWRPPTTRSPNS